MRKNNSYRKIDRSVRNWATDLALSPIDLLVVLFLDSNLDVDVCEVGWAGGVLACRVEVCDDVWAEEVVLYKVASLVGAKDQGAC